MILTRIFPGAAEGIDLEQSDARARLSTMYRVEDSNWLRLNLIASVDGSAVGADGTSESLTNSADRTLLGVIRNLADVVLVGAASVRVEGYQLPRTAPLAILTGTGNLTGHRVRTDVGQGRVIVICPGSAAERAVSSLGGIPADIVVVPDAVGAVPVAQAVDALRDRGLHRIVCEGGPNLAGQLLDAELVDEICLSTGPLLTSARLPVFDTKSERRLELSQLLVDDASGLYARWAVRRNAPGAQG